MRLALLTEIPAPYRLPLFRALAQEDGIELRVLYLARTDPRRGYPFPADEGGFSWEVLPGRGFMRGGRWVVVNAGVVRALRRFDPTVVLVGGWNQPAFWQALAFARARGRPLVPWVESTPRDARKRDGSPTRLKRLFVESATAFVVPGSAAAAYLQGLGVLEERIAVAPNATSLSALPEGQSLERGGRVVLFVGRLAPEKGLDILLEAARDLPVDVRVVGEGPDGARLRGSAPPNATFLGQLGQDALAQQYAEADVFVLPSLSEPWGMVLNEAAGAGLPLVATDACGAAYDLIEDGVNGFRIPAGDAGALREAVRRLVDDAALRDHAGRRSREIATRFTPDAWAAAVAALARRLAA